MNNGKLNAAEKKFMDLNVPERTANNESMRVHLCNSCSCTAEECVEVRKDCLFHHKNLPQFAKWLQQRNAAPDLLAACVVSLETMRWALATLKKQGFDINGSCNPAVLTCQDLQLRLKAAIAKAEGKP